MIKNPSDKKSCIVYGDFSVQTCRMSDAQKARLLDAILAFCNGEILSLDDDPILAMCWSNVLFRLQSDRASYVAKCADNKVNGSLGGKAKAQNAALPTATERYRTVPNGTEAYHNENYNENYNNENAIRGATNEQSRNLDSNADGSLDNSGLPDGGLLPVNFTKWSEAQFRSSVKQATVKFPELAPLADEFIGYWLEPLKNRKPRFTGEKAWDTTRRLKSRAAYLKKIAAGSVAMPTKKSDTAEEINRQNAEERADYLRRLAAEQKEAANV